VAPQGRFWVGMLGNDNNPLYRIDPDGSIHQMDDGILLSNGIHWSPDGETMYLADSLRRVIYAYDFEGSSGSISNRRVAVDTSGEEGLPDGISVDSQGCIWVAMCEGWQVMRYDPDGRLERRLKMPVECPTSCAFGGAQLNELYITSSRSLISPGTISHQPHAGDLFRLSLSIRGQRENIFGIGRG
jgi:sugar lactone lactonase YvrE